MIPVEQPFNNSFSVLPDNQPFAGNKFVTTPPGKQLLTTAYMYKVSWRIANALAALLATIFSLGYALFSAQIRWMWKVSITGKDVQTRAIQEIYDTYRPMLSEDD